MFKDFLTTEGERLLAKSIAGTATITFTKMEIGDGDLSTSTKAITSLANPRMTLDIYSVLLTGDNNIQITTMLESSAISDGFYFREKGLYATDGTTEILFMYGTASLAEWIEHVDSAVFTRTIRTVIALSAADHINITLHNGAYASSEDVERIITAIKDIRLDGDWAKYSQGESILSILDAFVAAYTTARAGKLDNLDTLISSRAPANTALSNAIWTNVRAGLLDNLDAKISSRAQASTALSNGVWTDARAGYLDNLINGTYGLAALKNSIDALKAVTGYYKPSGNLRYTFVSSEVSANDPNAGLKLGGFWATRNGCIRVIATIKSNNESYSAFLGIPKYNRGSSGGVEYTGTPKTTYANFYEIENGTAVIHMQSIDSLNSLADIASSNKLEYKTVDVTVWVERGQYIAFYLGVAYGTYGAYCNRLQVYFDEVN